MIHSDSDCPGYLAGHSCNFYLVKGESPPCSDLNVVALGWRMHRRTQQTERSHAILSHLVLSSEAARLLTRRLVEPGLREFSLPLKVIQKETKIKSK